MEGNILFTIVMMIFCIVVGLLIIGYVIWGAYAVFSDKFYSRRRWKKK